MKKILIIFFIALCSPVLAINIQEILNQRPEQVTSHINTPILNKNMLLTTRFSTVQIDKMELGELNKGTVLYVEYYYSGNIKNPDFNQRLLDSLRFECLKTEVPKAFQDAVVWKKYEILDPEGVQEKVFHGFKIVYQPEPTPEFMEEEIGNIELMLDSLLKGVEVEEREETTEEVIEIKEGIDVVSDELYASADSVVEGITYIGRKGILRFFGPKKYTVDLYRDDYLDQKRKGKNYIAEVFDRNPEWKDMSIVCDLTGSMSPYSAQLLAWFSLKQHDGIVKDFTFFNDGDNKVRKQIGETGGIYHTQASDLETVKKKAYECMRGGGGGDCPENNIEAALSALKQNPDCKEIIMLADNWATPRDLKLTKELKVPVHVIVCGAYGGINIAYINLALETGGSIHTIEQDIKDLVGINEGETIELMGKTYRLERGKFVEVHNI